MTKLKVLDLFSGIGGFSLGLERTGGFETVAFCEIDPFCQKVLKKHWPDVPIYNDVRTLDYDGAVDVITGGYPCQPFSTAGRRKGEDDDRHLWPTMFNLIQKHRPAWVIGENVNGHISMGLDNVLSDLGSSGYGARAFVIPAVAVDAKHRRDRVWIVANAQSAGKRGEVRNLREEDEGSGGSLFQQLNGASKGALPDAEIVYGDASPNNRKDRKLQKSKSGNNSGAGTLSNAASIGQSGSGQDNRRLWTEASYHREASIPVTNKACEWATESPVDRVVNGLPGELDAALMALGNAVVPQIPEIIGYAILEAQ